MKKNGTNGSNGHGDVKDIPPDEGNLPILAMLEQPALPWEQKENEGARAFEAFTVYRDMGPDRSVMKVAAELGKSRALIDMWRDKHGWQHRVTLYDRMRDIEKQRRLMKELDEMAERHAAIASFAMAKAFEKLQTIDDTNLSVANAIRLMEAGAMLERLSRGASTENVSAELRNAGGAIQIKTYDAYADIAIAALTGGSGSDSALPGEAEIFSDGSALGQDDDAG